MSGTSENITFGNAVEASKQTRGWFLGHFMPGDGNPLRSSDLELKWYTHAEGETRNEWAPGNPVRTLNVLVRGHFVLRFPGREVSLENEGDFVLFGPDVPHSFRSVRESLVLTVRWPSSVSATDENVAFIKEMLGSKRQLTDYPDRFDPDITMHEPQLLPFGGDYQGIAAFQEFYPEVRKYYDFSTWELLGVHGDGDTVFATTRVSIAGTAKSMYIAEQFTFSGRRLVDVRVHICDSPQLQSR